MTLVHNQPTADRMRPAKEATDATRPSQRYAIRRLRHLIPNHSEPMSWLEAERIAAAQGSLITRLARNADVDLVDFIATLPVVRVELDPALPDSCTSYWDQHSQQWVILVRATDPLVKRRFSIVHEFKRILDRGHETYLYDPRYVQGLVQAAMAADYFAACALMPASRVRVALRDGATAVGLARQFRVPVLRASSRLSDLNLLPVIKHPERRESP